MLPKCTLYGKVDQTSGRNHLVSDNDWKMRKYKLTTAMVINCHFDGENMLEYVSAK